MFGESLGQNCGGLAADREIERGSQRKVGVWQATWEDNRPARVRRRIAVG